MRSVKVAKLILSLRDLRRFVAVFLTVFNKSFIGILLIDGLALLNAVVYLQDMLALSIIIMQKQISLRLMNMVLSFGQMNL